MQKILKIVHLDDDPQSLESFKTLAESRTYFEYCGGFTKAESAAAFILQNDVDIAFLDIEMTGNNGLWLAMQIQHLPVDIIFLTAHAEYAVQAFAACALDFLQKPLYQERLDECMMRYHNRQRKKRDNQLLQIEELFKNYLPAQEVPKRIFISSIGSIKVILLKELLYFSAQENYTTIYLKDGSHEIASKTMKVYEEALVNNIEFVRIHRCFIVNKYYVKMIRRNGRKQKYSVVMTNGDELEISYLKKDEILAQLSL